MNHKPIVNRLLVILFVVLVGFSLAKSIYSQSILGMILAVVSLVAGIYFLKLLSEMKREQEY